MTAIIKASAEKEILKTSNFVGFGKFIFSPSLMTRLVTALAGFGVVGVLSLPIKYDNIYAY